MPSSELVQSLARGLDILESVARSESGLSLQEVAQSLGVQPSTAHNLARTLVARGFLRKSARPVRYQLGPVVPDLAEVHRSRGLLRRAAGVVRELSAGLGSAVVTLAEPIGGDVRILLRMSPERPGVLEQPRAWSLHPYGSASALVFQAFWTEEERAAYRRRHPFWETGGNLWGSPEEMDAFLEDVRRAGYSAPPTKEDGLFRVAAPVWGPSRDLRAALGVSAPAAHHESARYVEMVVSAAGRLSGRAADEEG